MPVTKHDLADWSRLLSDVVARHDTQFAVTGQGTNWYQLFLESSEGIPNPELKLEVVQMAGLMKEGHSPLLLMQEKPDIFDRWFIYVFGYGLMYAEIPQALDRYANRPEEVAFGYWDKSKSCCTSASCG